jgi:hypothetical protein
MNVPGDIRVVIDYYADRGLLRNVRMTLTDGRATRFQFTWHYNRTFDLVVDYEASRMAFTAAFPNVSPASAISHDLARFIEAMMADDVPIHRRVDRRKTFVSGVHSGDDMAVVATIVDGDFDYAARKLIQVANEIYFDFLPNSSHYAYQLESLGLDPGTVTFA